MPAFLEAGHPWMRGNLYWKLQEDTNILKALVSSSEWYMFIVSFDRKSWNTEPSRHFSLAGENMFGRGIQNYRIVTSGWAFLKKDAWALQSQPCCEQCAKQLSLQIALWLSQHQIFIYICSKQLCINVCSSSMELAAFLLSLSRVSYEKRTSRLLRCGRAWQHAASLLIGLFNYFHLLSKSVYTYIHTQK